MGPTGERLSLSPDQATPAPVPLRASIASRVGKHRIFSSAGFIGPLIGILTSNPDHVQGYRLQLVARLDAPSHAEPTAARRTGRFWCVARYMSRHLREDAEMGMRLGGCSLHEVFDFIGNVGGVLVDCTSSSPALAREISAAARAAGCYAVDAPVSGGDVGASERTLAIFAGGDESVAAWLAPLFGHLGKPTYMGPPGSGQSSKIANQIAVAGAVVGLGESVAFANAAGLDVPLFLDAISKGAAGSRVMGIFGDRVLRREFMSGGPVRYIIKDLGMALDVGDDQQEVNVLPGAALYWQMFSAMAANGDGDIVLPKGSNFEPDIEKDNHFDDSYWNKRRQGCPH
ncbi:hypothetical protein EJB05_04111, partial [Eragrostis curvula]